MKRHAEELKGWLTKWYGVRIGNVTGYVFVNTDELPEFLQVLESDPGKAHSLCVFRGPLLDPLNSFPVVKLLNLLRGEVVSSLIDKVGLSCILILSFDGEKLCCVCDGREKWACVFRTREKDTKNLLAHIFAILGFEERSYRYTGLSIYREGFSGWLERNAESGLLDYTWVRNELEKGQHSSRESLLLVKSIQNWFEDKTFSSCVFTLWFRSGKVGVWGLNHGNKITCVFSASGEESSNRELSEILGEVYDAYLSGIESKREAVKEPLIRVKTVDQEIIRGGTVPGLDEGRVEKEKRVFVESEAENIGEETVVSREDARPFNLFGKRLMEMEERVRNLEREVSRIRVFEGKIGNIDARLSSLGKVEGLEEAVKLLDAKASLIEKMVEEIRVGINVLNEQLGEFKKREVEIRRLINEFRGSK
ncbi:MAG: hypothetical protein KIH08_02670 [Candidatus Freyarchaeota archaeon]|nr:hypothetical protein [Candidatus Jordarchaeia archaeon]MBS7269514.1 hypothetical protein [Candidatus Jordarchaeia archaeon]